MIKGNWKIRSGEFPGIPGCCIIKTVVRLTALLLGLAFAAAQAVVLADCPCGSFCGHKNACPGEESPADDCCERSAGTHPDGERCSHLEPQTDLLSGASAPDLDAAASLLLLEAEPLALLLQAPAFDVPLHRALSPPLRGRPLYLLQRVFLI